MWVPDQPDWILKQGFAQSIAEKVSWCGFMCIATAPNPPCVNLACTSIVSLFIAGLWIKCATLMNIACLYKNAMKKWSCSLAVLHPGESRKKNRDSVPLHHILWLSQMSLKAMLDCFKQVLFAEDERYKLISLWPVDVWDWVVRQTLHIIKSVQEGSAANLAMGWAALACARSVSSLGQCIT